MKASSTTSLTGIHIQGNHPQTSRRAGLVVVALALLSFSLITARAQTFLFDFGAATTTTTFGSAPADDPLYYWNNVTPTTGQSSSGVVANLVTLDNTPTSAGLAILSRFNGANENGTTTSTLFPSDATRDSLFGNTELFSGLANVFPSFKLTGLDPGLSYDFTFFASRTGVSDNRETGYTLTGATSGFAALNASANVNNFVTAAGVAPTTGGEITVAMAPTANNNNANHFTYLGVMRVTAVPEPSSLALLALSAGMLICSRKFRVR